MTENPVNECVRPRFKEICPKQFDPSATCELCAAWDTKEYTEWMLYKGGAFIILGRYLRQRIYRIGAVLWSWLVDAWGYIMSEKGYRAVIPVIAALVGAHVGLYTIAEARHDRLMNRATYERSTFMSMVTSSNRALHSVAIKSFAPIQSFRIIREPTLWPPFGVLIEEKGQEIIHWPLWPWHWLTKKDYMPNREPLRLWAQVSIGGFPLRDVDLRGADLHDAKLSFTGMYGTKLHGANLNGTDLSKVVYLTQAQLDEACVNERTKLPEGLSRPQKLHEACKQWQ